VRLESVTTRVAGANGCFGLGATPGGKVLGEGEMAGSLVGRKRVQST
jgi:hypothetical protein